MGFTGHTARLAALASLWLLLSLAACGKGEKTAQNSASGSSGANAAETTTGDADAQEVVLSHGDPIDLAPHLVQGQINVIDFYSEFCPPCRRIAPHLRQMDAERSDITVIQVDINRPGVNGIDWQSPVARQFKLQSVPYFRVYDAQGRLLAEGRQAYEMVVGYIQGQS